MEGSKISDVLVEKVFNAGDIIIQEGDKDHLNMKFYLILKGTAEAYERVDETLKLQRIYVFDPKALTQTQSLNRILPLRPSEVPLQ